MLTQFAVTSMQQENLLSLPTQRVNRIVFTILALYPLVGMGIDLITPSLPAISRNLQVSNVVSKNLIAIYLVGYALGNFFIGFLSDALGRRKLMISGFFLFVIVSLLPIFLINPIILLWARFFQGFAIAAFVVVSRAVLSDVLTPTKLVRIATMVATMWGIGPVIGPVIGGYLQYYFNWQACFYFFALFGFIGLISVFFIVPETHFNRQKLNLNQTKNNLITILSHRVFIGIVTLMGLTYSLLIVFNTLGPFLIENELSRSPVYYGHLALVMGLVFLLGTMICRRLIKQYQPERILLFVIPFFFLIALLGVIIAYVDNRNIWMVIVPTFFMFLSCGIVYPVGMGKSLSLFRHLAGSSTAVMNLINILITSLVAFLMSFVNASSAIPLTWIYLGIMILSVLTYWFLVYKRNSKMEFGLSR